jgi:hypothetical protein
MPYCITLRSRTDARVTGWYTGRNCRWCSDRQRQIRNWGDTLGESSGELFHEFGTDAMRLRPSLGAGAGCALDLQPGLAGG